jgi:HEAT repeat protein
MIPLVIGAFVLLIQFSRRPDPSFHGRAASEWTRDLLSSDYQVRSDAQTALHSLGEAALPQLRVLLQQETPPWDPVLARISRVAPFVKYSPLDPVLCHQRGAEMAAILGEIATPAIPELISALGADQSAAEAARALGHIGEASIPALEHALHARSPDVRRRAADVLCQFIPLRRSSIQALAEAAGDAVPAVRRQAVLSLGRAKEREREAERAILAATTDPKPEVRAAAFTSLRSLACRSTAAISAARLALEDSAPPVRLESARALWEATGDNASVVPVLIALLQTTDGWQAAYALGNMGPAAADAVPSLITALRRERVPRPYRTPPSAASALGQIGKPSVAGLCSVLSDDNAQTRLGALVAFGFIGKNAREAVPRMLPLLKDPDTEVRHAAALTLAAIGAEPAQVEQGLSDCLNAEDIYMRSAAAQILREIAPDKQWVVYPE